MANGKPLNAPAHTTGFAAWIDRRFPIASFWKTHITGYYAPKNFNFWYFVVLYLHIFRGFLYGSYRAPRELVWIFGCMIFLCLMAEAFFGYLLPWGQMSYWGAQVITNLFSAIPGIGPDLALWIRGDYVVSDATLNRFFALHVIAIPLLLLALVGIHLIALR